MPYSWLGDPRGMRQACEDEAVHAANAARGARIRERAERLRQTQ